MQNVTGCVGSIVSSIAAVFHCFSASLVMASPYIVALQTVALISILSSASVILTLFFKGLREKLFMRIIAFISFSDLIANIPYASERRPDDDTPLCTLSAFFNIYFYPAGWLWTAVLMLLLYSLATTGKLPFSRVLLHLVCWGVPLVLALLNFAFGKSQSQQNKFAFDICLLGGTTREIFIYHMVSYYGLFLVCIMAMMFMYWNISRIDKSEIKSRFPSFKEAKNTLQLYPLALVVCWVPHFITILCADFAPFEGLNEFFFVADILKILHGSVTAVIFFYKSGEARNKWHRLFIRRANSVLAALGKKQFELRDNRVRDFSVEYEVGEYRRSDSFLRNSFILDQKLDISAIQADGSVINIPVGGTATNRMHSEPIEDDSVEIS